MRQNRALIFASSVHMTIPLLRAILDNTDHERFLVDDLTSPDKEEREMKRNLTRQVTLIALLDRQSSIYKWIETCTDHPHGNIPHIGQCQELNVSF